MERQAKIAHKVEHKVGILIGGLLQRDAKLRKQVEDAWGALQGALTDLECFKVRSGTVWQGGTGFRLRSQLYEHMGVFVM